MILEIILLAVVAFFLYYSINFFLLPKIRMEFYVNQGIKKYKFFPLYGWFKDILFQKPNKYKDSLYEMKNLSRDPEYKDEDIILGNITNQAFLTLIKPELINEFLQKQNDYIKYELPLYGFIQFLGHGLAKTYGDEWKKSRKVISSMFTFEQISSQLGRVKEITRSYINKENPNDFNIKYVFEKISGSSDLQVLLGAEVEKYKDSQGRHLGELIEQLSSDITVHYISPIPVIFGQKIVSWNLRESDRKIQQRMQEMREFMKQILIDCVNREKDPNYKPDFPSYITFSLRAGLLQKPDEINELLATTFSLYMAAKDTTSKLTCMVIYNLIKHPEEFKLVFDEIMKYTEKDDYTFSDLQQMNHLQANIKETMRMDPSAPFIFTREALKDHTLGKYQIKKGTLINIGYLSNFYNEKYFKEPLSYKPSRWFDKEEDMKMRENHFVFIPFSGGARNCIGQHLAMMQIKVMVIEFVKKFEVPKIPLNFDTEKTLTQSYGFKYPLKVQLQNRKY